MRAVFSRASENAKPPLLLLFNCSTKRVIRQACHSKEKEEINSTSPASERLAMAWLPINQSCTNVVWGVT